MSRSKSAWLGVGLAVVVTGMTVSAQFVQAPQQAPISNEFYAANLGIWYRLVPYSVGGGFTSGQGNYDPNSPPGYPGPVTYGARLSRYPVPGSPCAYLQLEPGDMIISLDNLPFYGTNDILAHVGQTSMVFVNVRTNQPQAANLFLPQ